MAMVADPEVRENRTAGLEKPAVLPHKNKAL
jgi:hypothetical protein